MRACNDDNHWERTRRAQTFGKQRILQDVPGFQIPQTGTSNASLQVALWSKVIEYNPRPIVSPKISFKSVSSFLSRFFRANKRQLS